MNGLAEQILEDTYGLNSFGMSIAQLKEIRALLAQVIKERKTEIIDFCK